MSDVDLITAAVAGVAAEPVGRRNEDVLHDFDLPAMVRGFIAINQGPATETMAIREAGFMPRLYASYRGERVRVTMVSRLGDVGVSRKDEEYGYFDRCSIYDLSEFGDEMHPTAPAKKPFVKNFGVASREGMWVKPYRGLSGVPDFITAPTPYLFCQRGDAVRWLRDVDQYGLKGLKIVPLLLSKVQE